uniref:DRBM domain-containing protein n=1 Tax=Arundo donax TaxID=35708 RepID=A0A0A9GBE8_ARUDO
MTLFVASIVFDGNTYTGEAAANMKDAKQKAARAVIKSVLATENTCMMGIIRSKKNLITAIKSSRNNKDTGAPIKFTRPVAYTEYGGQDHVAPESQDESSSSRAVQGHAIVPAVEPSAKPSTKTVTGSKKRKGRVEGPDVNEARGC